MSVPDAEYQKALVKIGEVLGHIVGLVDEVTSVTAERDGLKIQLAAILLERDGHRGYGETVRHLREDVRNLREENERLRKELAKLEHPLILAEGGTSDADRAIRVINKLSSPQWYWDDRELDSATKSIGSAIEHDELGDIVELRPLHELPRVFVLVADKGYQVFESRQAAEEAST